MNNKQQFLDWQDDYQAAEWKNIAQDTEDPLESGVHSVEDSSDPPFPENTTQRYVKSYYQDLNSRRSHILSLRLVKIALIFAGLITLVFIPKAPLKAKMDEVFIAFQGQNQEVETLANSCATQTTESPESETSETTEIAKSEDCTEADSITNFVNKLKEFKEKRNHHNDELQEAINES